MNIKKWEDYDILELPDGSKIDMLKLLEEQDRAKAALSHIEPFFAGLLGKIRFVYTFHVDTQATDGYNIFVNPKFTSMLDLEQKVFVLAHEVMHCVFNHLRRAKAANHNMEKSNIAADYEVNTWLEQLGIVSKSTIQRTEALYDSKYNDWGYEKIYDSSPKGPSQPQQSPNNNGSSSSQSNSNQGDPQSSNSQSNSNQGNPQNSSSQSNSNQGNSQNGGRGEGKVGKVHPEDMTTNRDVNNTHSGNGGIAGGFCDKQDGEKLAEQEGYDKDSMSESSREGDWKEAAMKESSKLKGNIAGKLKSTLDGLYKVTTNWKKTLKNIVGRSLNPAEFRQAFANKNVLVSQSRIARTDKDKYDNLDYICCFVDSSVSMSDHQLKLIMSEVYSLALQKKPCRLIIIQCDTRIQDIKEYTNLQQLKKDIVHAEIKGRGGTELKPCWDLLKSKDKRFNGRRCELVMCFTDGYCNQYKRDIKTMQNLVWCILDNPSFQIENKDANTKVIYFKTADIK